MSTMTLPSVDQTPQQKQQRTLKPGPLPALVTKIDTQPPVPNDEDNYQMTMAAFVRVDVKLPIPHRVILRDKLRKLQDSGAKLQDGTEVTDKTKAVLWILENEVA